MSCPNCTCSTCRMFRRRGLHRRALYALVRSWDWNAAPDEARRELQESVFSNAEAAGAMRQLCFPDDQITSVTGL